MKRETPRLIDPISMICVRLSWYLVELSRPSEKPDELLKRLVVVWLLLQDTAIALNGLRVVGLEKHHLRRGAQLKPRRVTSYNMFYAS